MRWYKFTVMSQEAFQARVSESSGRDHRRSQQQERICLLKRINL
jgi:hypothetical protein